MDFLGDVNIVPSWVGSMVLEFLVESRTLFEADLMYLHLCIHIYIDPTDYKFACVFNVIYVDDRDHKI